MAEAVPSEPACGHLERHALVTPPRRFLKPPRTQHNRAGRHDACVNFSRSRGTRTRLRRLHETVVTRCAAVNSNAPVTKLLYVQRMSTDRILVSSETDFEAAVGYSRAVRVGPLIAVSGTTDPAASDGIAAQTREVLRRIGIALVEVGATLSDVIRPASTSPTSRAGGRLRPCTPRSSVTSVRRRPWSKLPRSSSPDYSWRSKPTPTRRAPRRRHRLPDGKW